jgi:hypothetical protein
MKELDKGYIKKVRVSKQEMNEVAYVYFLALIGFLIGIVLLVWFGLGWLAGLTKGVNNDEDNYTEVVEIVEDECDFRRVLDGVCVNEWGINPKVVGVMIDNHPEARPQSSISKASVVYEAPVEGNYTRYFALFPVDAEIEKVGPVRSARPYFLDWLAEYSDALYLHVGGSPDGLALIKMRQVLDMDEFFAGWYFWRSATRLVPHNTYTSSEFWNEYLEDKEREDAGEYGGWFFAEQEECEENCITSITIPFLRPYFVPSWVYEDGRYTRYQDNAKYMDLEGGNVVADVVIIQKVKTEVLDEKGRKEVDTISEGESIVFQKGYAMYGTWKKDSLSGRTRFFDIEGLEIVLQPGQIWIEVVQEEADVLYE